VSLSPVIASRAAGLLAGLCLVGVAALFAWRVPASARPAAVSVDVRAVPSGEVGVSPAAPLLGRSSVAPGGPAARGTVRLTNRTAGALAARPRVTDGDPALDRLVEVELRTAGRVVFRGPLGGLRSGVSTPVPLPRGGSATVAVRVSVPGSAAPGALARAGRWTLTFTGAPAR
jgi:hypothetical protein